MNSLILTIACLLIAAAVVAAFLSKWWAAPVALGGLVVMALDGAAPVTAATCIFWGVAAAIVVALAFLLPSAVTKARDGVSYIVGACLAGTLVGMLVSHPGMIIGSVAGAFFGAVAYCRTPAGRRLGFPSGKAVNYLCAKSFPAIVTMCIIGTVIAVLSANNI